MRLFLIAGEPSGDALGGALMDGLRTLLPDVAFAGVGGPSMQAAGLQSLFPMADLSVMGLAEVLPKYRHLKRRIRETAAGSPMKTASPMRKWPMLSSRICGMAAIGETVSKVSPWPA